MPLALSSIISISTNGLLKGNNLLGSNLPLWHKGAKNTSCDISEGIILFRDTSCDISEGIILFRDTSCDISEDIILFRDTSCDISEDIILFRGTSCDISEDIILFFWPACDISQAEKRKISRSFAGKKNRKGLVSTNFKGRPTRAKKTYISPIRNYRFPKNGLLNLEN